jgi:hypothetical protein
MPALRSKFDFTALCLSLLLIAFGLAPISAVAQSLPSCRSFWAITPVKTLTEGDNFIVPLTINGKITLDFILDSGASDVSIPADVVSTLIRTKTIRKEDFLGEQKYELADTIVARAKLSNRFNSWSVDNRLHLLFLN